MTRNATKSPVSGKLLPFFGVLREAVGILEDNEFASKPQNALEQVLAAHERGVRTGTVFADPNYGNNYAYHEELEALDIRYIMHINSTSLVSPSGVSYCRPSLTRSVVLDRRGPAISRGHEHVSRKQLALSIDENVWEYVIWSGGTNAPLRSWFTAMRVHVTHEDQLRDGLSEEQWLLVEWPDD